MIKCFYAFFVFAIAINALGCKPINTRPTRPPSQVYYRQENQSHSLQSPDGTDCHIRILNEESANLFGLCLSNSGSSSTLLNDRAIPHPPNCSTIGGAAAFDYNARFLSLSKIFYGKKKFQNFVKLGSYQRFSYIPFTVQLHDMASLSIVICCASVSY